LDLMRNDMIEHYCEAWIDVSGEPCDCPDGPCSEHPCGKPAPIRSRGRWLCADHYDAEQELYVSAQREA